MRPRNLAALVLVVVLGCVSFARAGTPSIVIDGSKLPTDVPALVGGGHVLVPLRGVFERFGAHVWYDASSQTASASLNETLVQVTVGSRTAWVNGARRTMDVGVREVAGRVMIPLRFVAQALGVSVDYDGPTDTVVIVSGFRPGSFAASAGGPVVSEVPKQSPSVEDVRPASGALIGSQYPSIYARFKGGSSAVNPSAVRITVDGADVTDGATISSAYVSYTPSAALQTGQHTVSITGAADDGTPFSASWSFRIDAGSSSDYTAHTYSGGSAGFNGFGGFNGFDGFGGTGPFFGFPRFGFFPPGFSVFTPGQLFFVSGGVIEVIFVSRFFPFGTAFFTISGFPGVFPLTPWLGFPGFFWGFAQVPFGVTAHNAVIAADFTMADGRKIIVHSTAPMQIEGRRTSLPSNVRYAVIPRLIDRPKSPHQLVVFNRMQPRLGTTRPGVASWSRNLPQSHAGFAHLEHVAPIITRNAPVPTHPAPMVIHPAPVVHSVIHPAPIFTHPQPIIMPAMRGPAISQWQSIGPMRAPVSIVPAKPR